MVKKNVVKEKNEKLQEEAYGILYKGIKKGLIDERSYNALSKKIVKGRNATIEKLIDNVSGLYQQKEKISWASIQRFEKKGKDNDKDVPVVKNTKGNIFIKKQPDDDDLPIGYKRQNIFRKVMSTVCVNIYRPAGDSFHNLVKIDGEDMILIKSKFLTLNDDVVKTVGINRSVNNESVRGQLLINAIKNATNNDNMHNLLNYPYNKAMITAETPFGEQGTIISPRKLSTIPLNDSITQEKIKYRYITYGCIEDPSIKDLKNLFDTKLKNYTKENYVENACLFTEIIDTYTDVFKELKKRQEISFDLTYENLYRLIFPDKEYDENDMSATIYDMIPFFRKFRIRCIALDIKYRIVFNYHPKDDELSINTLINPQCFYILIHNTHAYKLNKNIKSLEQIIGGKDQLCEKPPIDKEKELTTTYFIHDKPKTQNDFYCSCVEEISNIPYIKFMNAEYEDKFLTIHYAGDIYLLLQYFITTFKYEPSIGIHDNSLYKFTFEINNIIVCITQAGYNAEDADDNLSEKDFYLTMELRQSLYESIINKATKSIYNKNFISILREYHLYPLTGKLCNGDAMRICDALEIDYNKAYTSNLMDIEKFPVFNTFDNFFPYDYHEIEDYTIYHVESQESDNLSAHFILFPKKHSVVYGYVLNRFQHNVIIIAYARPSKLIKNKSTPHIKKIYESSLPTSVKKDIVNKVIGCFGKLKNNRDETIVFQDYEEAAIYEKEFKVKALKLAIGEHKYLYAVVKRESKELIDGFFPLTVLIYDIMRLKMAKLYKDLDKTGTEIYGIHTDCFYVEPNNDITYEAKKKGDFKFEDIGSISKERKNTIPSINLLFKKNDGITHKPIKESNTLKIKDEWDTDEINHVLRKNNKTIVKASVPGAGKTTTLINYVKASNKKGLFITPYNKLGIKFVEEGLETMTLHQLLGLRFSGNEETQGKKRSIEEYDIIVFEEIYCHTTLNLSRILDFMTENSDKKYYATGDPSQLSPIEDIHVKDTKKYYDYIIGVIFPNEIYLQESKRVKTEEDRQKLKDIKHDIFETDTPLLTIAKKYFKIASSVDDIKDEYKIAYYNDVVHWLNIHAHSKIKYPNRYITYNGVRYFKGMELVCRKYIKIKTAKLIINYTYIIKKINDTHMTITDYTGNLNIELDINMLSKFTLNYAGTCHSVQGSTIEGDIMIFNLTCFNVSLNREWFWTALTRATDLSKISIYNDSKGEMFEIRDIEKKITEKITGHIDYDKKRKFKYDTKDYVNVDWAMKKLYKCRGRCHRCGIDLQTSRYDAKDQNQFSINRIDSNHPHVKDNCEIICLSCNVIMKDK